MRHPFTLCLLACLAGVSGTANAQQDGLTSEFLPRSASVACCRASTIAQTTSGVLVAAWHGGSKEGAPDVGIWLSRRDGVEWTAPVEVANGNHTAGQRHPCWNPVLFQPTAGPLVLFYKVGPNPCHWWGMLRTSDDAGKTWSNACRLPDGVFGPTKSKPIQLANGDWLCPSSVHSPQGWRVRFERTADSGKTWTRVEAAPPTDGKKIDAMDPAVIVHSDGRLQAIGQTRSDQVFQTWSADNGKTWSPVTLTGLPNPNSGVDAVTLRDGRHLLVYNHSIRGSGSLSLAVTRDGKTWRNEAVLDRSRNDDPNGPACIQTRDGMVHITYTWQDKRIKHVAIDPATLPRWNRQSAQVSGNASSCNNLPVAPPGVVIDYRPAWSGLYLGSPSIAILPNGDYAVSHDFYGPNSNEGTCARSVVFRSSDRGRSWKKTADVQSAFWSTLFAHRGSLYLLGLDRGYGNLVIHRSKDGGDSWTSPADSTTGLLDNSVHWHCAPTPVIEHNGRLWRGVEWTTWPLDHPATIRAGMMSAPVDADLLNAASWTYSRFLPSECSLHGSKIRGWLEGNAVVAPSGDVVSILRTGTTLANQKAAIIHISADGRRASFDPAAGIVDLPGAGQHKFTIRFDPQTQLYWSLTNASLPEPWMIPKITGRNKLALVRSGNLKDWTVVSVLLSHPDRFDHAFQYADWRFDGEDIVAVCRTAYDDGLGGAHDFHDANFLTFHRIPGFRTRTMSSPLLSN